MRAIKDHLREMLGAFFEKMLIALGVRKASPTPRVASEPADDDFVARHGLSYGEAADPISKEAHFEVERLKSIKPHRR
jgi:hypothetical protein